MPKNFEELLRNMSPESQRRAGERAAEIIKEQESNMKFKCHCCGNRTMRTEPTDTYDICPVCFWEHEFEDMSECFSANGVTLSEARENYKRIGACSEKDLPHVRKPTEEEDSE